MTAIRRISGNIGTLFATSDEGREDLVPISSEEFAFALAMTLAALVIAGVLFRLAI